METVLTNLKMQHHTQPELKLQKMEASSLYQSRMKKHLKKPSFEQEFAVVDQLLSNLNLPSKNNKFPQRTTPIPNLPPVGETFQLSAQSTQNLNAEMKYRFSRVLVEGGY